MAAAPPSSSPSSRPRSVITPFCHMNGCGIAECVRTADDYTCVVDVAHEAPAAAKMPEGHAAPFCQINATVWPVVAARPARFVDPGRGRQLGSTRDSASDSRLHRCSRARRASVESVVNVEWPTIWPASFRAFARRTGRFQACRDRLRAVLPEEGAVAAARADHLARLVDARTPARSARCRTCRGR